LNIDSKPRQLIGLVFSHYWKSSPYPGFEVYWGKIHFEGGKIFVFNICLKQVFSCHNTILGEQTLFGGTAAEWPPWLRAC